MRIEQIADVDDPRIAAFRNVRDRELIGQRSAFIAEGRLVVGALLHVRSRFAPSAVLVTPAALGAMSEELAACPRRPPVFVASQAVMDGIVGFHIHRGCLAVGEIGPEPTVEDLLARAADGRRFIVVLEGLLNHDNVGAIFRNAAAFGAHACLLTPGTCSPLYRKALRVSMGAALRVPFATIHGWPGSLERLREQGWRTVALTPADDAVDIAKFVAGAPRAGRTALVVGAEGPGLTADALAGADVRVRIPMAAGTDSLNVATAAAIAMHRLSGP